MLMRSVLSLLVRRALPGLLCASTLVACEPGNDLERFSGRHLRATMVSRDGNFLALLEQLKPEAGCLQLHPDVSASFDGTPLQVFPGGPIVDPDRCFNAPPNFTGKLDTDPFFGDPRNAVMEIQDGDERIVAEFTNYYARHGFELVAPPPAVKPGQEVFLKWEPPTDDISQFEAVTLNGQEVPATPEAGGVRFTIPSDFPAGRVDVYWVGEWLIPAERCEGAALCTATTWPMGLPSQLNIQP
ncbi:hypothetical protein [Hyalangium gracile]|uniref:hypothetical protein n=1 Tax=Hyalangium gracile TaxID=394092 RepID=UPI001CCE8DBF|nr:hypothetical protein [Hyalangium gracile]